MTGLAQASTPPLPKLLVEAPPWRGGVSEWWGWLVCVGGMGWDREGMGEWAWLVGGGSVGLAGRWGWVTGRCWEVGGLCSVGGGLGLLAGWQGRAGLGWAV